MNEAEFERQMLRRLSGAMSETEARAFEEAVRLDPAWRRRLALWQGAWQAAGAADDMDRDGGAPPGLRTRIVAQAAAGSARDRRGLWVGWPAAPAAPGWQRAGGAASAAAVLALGVVLGVLLTPAQEPSLAAAEGSRGPVVTAAAPLETPGASTPVPEAESASEVPYLLAETGEDGLDFSGVGLGEAGLAALESLFGEADPS